MASAAQSLLSIEDYLRMTFEGVTPEYVNGELVERSEPLLLHSITQQRCLRMLDRSSERLIMGPEMHLRVSARQIRIADIAAFRGSEPTEQIPSTPPFLVVEVVSPDDRFIAIHTKLEEYRHWGVKHVWLVDPWQRKVYAFTSRLEEVEKLEIPELAISITATDLFDQPA